MGEFSQAWLALRESADARARAADLPLLLRPHLARENPLMVLDLGCGTGSNLRLLAPSLGGAQQWQCLDADPELLAQVEIETRTWAGAAGCGWDEANRVLSRPGTDLSCGVETRRLDLARSLDGLPVADVGLVTASALLDLVSDEWLEGLVARYAAARTPMLMVLTYDGRAEFEPILSLDSYVIDSINVHQRRDKGFGPALGPAANARLAALATAYGYRVEVRTSDWTIGCSDRALQAALINGWCDAACEQTPLAAPEIRDWREARLGAVARGCSRIRVGHRDLLAIPGRS
jgi:SAM-dependent methyltransferase